MTIAPVAGPSWVQIDLDTTAPVVVLDAPSRVSPPDPWVVLVRANEDLGPVAAVFTDAYGTAHRLGVERVSARLLSVVMPTLDVATGPGELRVLARDRACNATEVSTPVVIERPRAFDVVLEMGTGQEVSVSMDGGFEAEIGFEHGHDVATGVDGAYETDSGMDSGLDTTLEITSGN